MLLDQVNLESIERAIDPQATTGATSALVSQIIDLAAKDSCTFNIYVGALYSGASFTAKLEESANSDMSSATDVSADATKLIGTIAAISTANTLQRIGYKGGQRYVRLTVTAASGGATSYVSADCATRNKKIGTGPTGS